LKRSIITGLVLISLVRVTVEAQEAVMSWTSDLLVNTNFGGYSGDYFAELFIPPSDGYINTIDFNMSDLPDVPGGRLSVAIHAAEYPWDEIDEEEIADIAPGSWLGYYNRNDTLGIAGDSWVFGGVNHLDGADSTYQYDPLGEKLWPQFGTCILDLSPTASDEDMVTLDLTDQASGVFEFSWAEPFILVVGIEGFDDEGDAIEYRTGFFSAEFHHTPQPCLKFYNTQANPNGRTGINDWGWHIRSYVWDWSLHVAFTGGPFYSIDLEQIPTTLTQRTRVVSARILPENPSGDHAVIAADLHYSIENEVSQTPMEYHEGMYIALLPAQEISMDVDYWVTIELANGHTLVSDTKTYSIFSPESPTLLVYDTDHNLGEAWRYMEGLDSSFSQHYDFWEPSFGPVTSELVTFYSTIYHVMGGGPHNYAGNLSMVYPAWLASGTLVSPHCLLLSGQDYGVFASWIDSTFNPYTFEGQYLGVDRIWPQDINYNGTPESYRDPYAVNAISDHPLTGNLAAYAGGDLQLFYEPLRELGFSNWIDNLIPSSAEVCLTDPNQDNAAVALYNSGAGWKTSYWALDPLGLNFYDPMDTLSNYISAVEAVGNPVRTIFEWFRGALVLSDLDDIETPKRTSLNANYPNPFNSGTTISYDLPIPLKVTLKVFNIQGQEVITLVDDLQSHGEYEVFWNGKDEGGHLVPSGIYCYTLSNDVSISTRKMLLLK